jgi:hypothetical protein
MAADRLEFRGQTELVLSGAETLSLGSALVSVRDTH